MCTIATRPLQESAGARSSGRRRRGSPTSCARSPLSRRAPQSCISAPAVSTLPASFLTVIVPLPLSSATPAESYPLYSSRLSPSSRIGATSSSDETAAMIPHMFVKSDAALAAVIRSHHSTRRVCTAVVQAATRLGPASGSTMHISLIVVRRTTGVCARRRSWSTRNSATAGRRGSSRTPTPPTSSRPPRAWATRSCASWRRGRTTPRASLASSSSTIRRSTTT